MGKFTYNNKDVRELVEITTNSSMIDGGVLSYSPEALKIAGVLTSSSERTTATPSSDYIYAQSENLDGKLKINGSPASISKIGHRPDFKTELVSTGAGTYYLNWFENGEVWLSTTENSASGTQLSTTTQKRKVFIVSIFGAGGGGGSSQWGVFVNHVGSGAGGGGMLSACLYLTAASGSIKITIGSGGTCGKDGGGGAGGGSSYIYNGTSSIVGAYGGAGGSGNEGPAGSGGSSNPTGTGTRLNCNGFTLYILKTASGASGGTYGVTSKSTSKQEATKYSPEGATNGEIFTYSPGYSNDGRTGSGTATGCGGCGYAGKGGRSTGDAIDGAAGGPTGGGSGGGKHAATNRWGGNGGAGVLKIYV